MSDHLPSATEARAELAKVLKYARAFLGLDKTLAVLENLEQVERERTAAAAAAQAAMLDAQAQLAEAEAARTRALDDARSIASQASAYAIQTKDNARAVAAQTIADAERTVAPLKAEADALAGEVRDARAELVQIQAQAEQARAVIAEGERIAAALKR